MKLFALTSDQFQTLALGWVGALTAVAIATGYAVAKVWPIIVDIKARFDSLSARVDRQGVRQDAQAATVAQVALSVPPPAAPPVADNPVLAKLDAEALAEFRRGESLDSLKANPPATPQP